MDGNIRYVARPAVQSGLFSKGLTISLAALTGHDLELVSFYALASCDATVATRQLSLNIKDSAGNTHQVVFNVSLTASQSKTYQGPVAPGGGGADVYIQWDDGLIIPTGGTLVAAETNFVAGDSWSIRFLYRDIPVDLLV